MMYPMVQEIAPEVFPVTVTCVVLGFTPQAFYKWAANPICDRDFDDARLTKNAIVDINGDDPELGYRFIAEELERRGHEVGEGRVHRLCRQHKIWSATTKKGRRSAKTPGPAVHDDLVNRDFSAPAPDATWLTDITENQRPKASPAPLLHQGLLLEPNRRLHPLRLNDSRSGCRLLALSGGPSAVPLAR